MPYNRSASGPEFASIDHYQAPAGRDAAPHRHETWKVTLYRRGHIKTTVDGAEFFVNPGSVLVVPPKGAHGEYALTGYANSYLMFRAPQRWPWPVHISADESGRIPGIFDAVADEAALQSTPTGRELIDLLVRELDLRLRRFVKAPAVGPLRTVEGAERIFATRSQQSLRLDAVAAELGVSVATLRSHFDQILGTSPSSRLFTIRLDQAVTLLRMSDLTVESVALRCGFHSSAHLARYIRREYGSSPSQLRSPRDTGTATGADS